MLDMFHILLSMAFGLILVGTILGGLIFLWYHVNSLTADLRNSRSILDEKILEFKEVTEKASAANQSHANLLLEIQEKVSFFDERLSRLDNTIKMGAGNGNKGNIWRN